jgi:riboflavin kinase/FMN adenylyltransferase
MEFAAISSDDFIKKIPVDTIHAKKMITGFNHSFGRERNGGYEKMLEYGGLYGFSVDKYPEYIVHNRKISSTHIRELVGNGKIKEANESLDYDFMIIGRFMDGVLEIDNPMKIIPADGNYLCRVYVDKLQHYAVCQVRRGRLIFEDLSFVPAESAATAEFIKEL